MTALDLSIEGLSNEVLEFYQMAGLSRAAAGSSGVSWSFAGNPQPFAVARRAGRIVGLSAYIRSRMIFEGQLGWALQAVDSFVGAEVRGKGVFTRLARAYDDHARASQADLVWGFPNDNAAPAWFGRLGWHRHGQVPMLIKPLRAGYFLRKLRMPFDFPISRARDQNLTAIADVAGWADEMWARIAPRIGCGTIRDRAFLRHRLFEAPAAAGYRVVADTHPQTAALVATCEAEKHGGRIAYLLEAMGGVSARDLLMSELGRLRDRGVELVLAWCFPWSPNFRMLRGAGFLPLPERIRPIRIWFGSRPQTGTARCADWHGQWYLSCLDSDTV